MAARGRLIALEGIDGCGKSTQARAVAAALGAQLTFEPGATPAGAELRRILLAPDAPHLSLRGEALLMVADRAEHVANVVEPALASGAWVVTDRYADSTIAYQGYGQGLDPQALATLVAWATDGVVADLAVLVDVPVEVATARLAGASGRGGPDRLEGLGGAFAGRVRQGFLALAAAEPSRWLVVDGREEPDTLTSQIVGAVRSRFGDPPGALR